MDDLLEETAGTAKIAGIRLRIRPPKRQTPTQRLKRRLYYRRNRTRIIMKRRRYLRTHRSILKSHRKLFKRFKPAWIKKPKHSGKPRASKKFKISIPHLIRPKKPRLKTVHSPSHKKR